MSESSVSTRALATLGQLGVALKMITGNCSVIPEQVAAT
jgi:hypothetical protein